MAGLAGSAAPCSRVGVTVVFPTLGGESPWSGIYAGRKLKLGMAEISQLLAQSRVNLISGQVQKCCGRLGPLLGALHVLQDHLCLLVGFLPKFLLPPLFGRDGLVQRRYRQHVYQTANDESDPERVERALPP